MRNSIVFMISIVLLSTLIAKVSAISITNASPISKSLGIEQNEKIDVEEEKLTTYDQLKNDELMFLHYHSHFPVAELSVLFVYLSPILPSSYLKTPKRPPQTKLF